MSAPLETCRVEEQGSVIKFLLSKDTKPVENYLRILKQYGEKFLSRGNLYKWIKQFNWGRTSVTDLHRSTRQVKVLTDVLQNRVNDLIRNDRRIKIAAIADMCNVNTGTA